MAKNSGMGGNLVEMGIGIAILVAIIGFIAVQITSAEESLLNFPGAFLLLTLVPLAIIGGWLVKIWRTASS